LPKALGDAARGDEFLGELFRRVGVEVENGNLRAAFGKRAAEAGAKNARAARYDYGFSAKIDLER
jgi:hypothetical protein